MCVPRVILRVTLNIVRAWHTPEAEGEVLLKWFDASSNITGEAGAWREYCDDEGVQYS